MDDKMNKKTGRRVRQGPRSTQTGGVSFSGSGNVLIKGHVVGKDFYASPDDAIRLRLSEQFAKIQSRIDKLPDDGEIDKKVIRQLVRNIEDEVKKGDSGDPNKVKKWFKFLASMSDDIYEVTVAALANPVMGVAKTLRLIAKKAKES